MKTPQKGRASPTQKGATTAAKLTKISTTQNLVERADRFLAGINHYRLPDGLEATRVLDLCERFDGIRTKLREKAEELLLREPDAIPGWHVSEIPQRVLSKNTLKVFIAAAHADSGLTAEEFLTGCTTSLTALRKLLARRNPDWTADDLEHELNRVLEDLISYQTVTRLSRSKDKQLGLSL